MALVLVLVLLAVALVTVVVVAAAVVATMKYGGNRAVVLLSELNNYG